MAGHASGGHHAGPQRGHGDSWICSCPCWCGRPVRTRGPWGGGMVLPNSASALRRPQTRSSRPCQAAPCHGGSVRAAHSSVGFALGVPRSARSRRNGLETSEGYKVGVLTQSGCPGLPGPRPSVSPLLRLGPNTRLAGPGLSAWLPGVHPVAGPPPAPAAGLCWCHGEALAVFSRLSCILTGRGARGQALGPCPPLTGTQTLGMRGPGQPAADTPPTWKGVSCGEQQSGGSQALGLECHELPAARW